MTRTSQIRLNFALVLLIVVSLATLLHAGPPEPASADALAEQVFKATGVQGGLAVHLGCSDGRLTAALRVDDRFLVQGLAADTTDVERTRAFIRAQGVYGPVSVDAWSGPRLPYADNVVNLLIADKPMNVSLEETMRVLVPGGVLYRKDGKQWSKTVKPWPNDIDEWTHWLHNASGNAVARDRVVGPPERLQWVEGPRWSRHHNTTPSLNAAVSAGGRIFYIVDEAPPAVDNSLPDRYSLFARDAFNGVLLWKTPIEDWGWKAWVQTMYSNFMLGRHMHPTQIQRRLVAVGDRVYVTLGFNAPVSELDAATGERLRTFAGSECTSEILHFQDRLVLAVNREPQRAGYLREDPPVKKQVKVIDLATGELSWEAGDFVGVSVRGSSVQRVTQLTMAVGPEGVFLVEEDALVGLDLKTGREMWRVKRPARPSEKVTDGYRNDHTNLCTLVYDDGRVLFGQPRAQAKKPPWNTTQESDLLVIDAKKGNVLWTKGIGSWEYGTPIGIYVIDGLIWVHAQPDEPYTLLALDPATGKEIRRIPTRAVFNSGHHHRCTRNKATQRFLITSRRGVELTGLADGSTQVNQWIRGECGYGMLPCNGLIYTTPHPCRCFIEEKLSGIYALAPGPVTKDESQTTSAETRLEKGAAFANIPHSARPIPHSEDWPTYRHDPGRSGSTPARVPPQLRPKWQVDIGARPTAPVIAGGKVFVAAAGEHRVCALDAADGKPLWSFTAGGPIDTPPTVHRGLVLFGCRDGCLYCLTAEDGQLAWRLRAAPDRRRLVAFGQLESAWPVHGSVLVVDGVVYCAAGHSSHLDGGIRVLAVDPTSGEVLREDTLSAGLAESQQGGARGALADLLVFDGQAIRMRQLSFARVNPSSDSRRQAPLHLLATGGLLDDSWFNRIFWSVNRRALGEYLVFDETAAYGIRSYQRPGDVNAHFTPGKNGYLLFANDHLQPKPPASKQDPTAKRRRGKGVPPDRWTVRVPIRSQSMVLAGDVLFVAGLPDVVDSNDPWAAFDGRRGGLLWSIAADDGSKLAECTLDAAPTFDGMAATPGHIYLTTKDGKLRCLAGQ